MNHNWRKRKSKCGKRCYSSKNDARIGSRKISNKIRVYFCDVCHFWHVTNSDYIN